MENPLPTANRNCVIFPSRINGKYAIYHQPGDRAHTPFEDVFYATSSDMIHWGTYRLVAGIPTADQIE